ncbi:MAG: 30S ribosomal protein S20 [Phycisphaerae bacterium]|nr:30S ribosomal protein S20 [Phycisphaerae bacterium]
MAHSLSAKKRARQNAKARTRNRARKSIVKTQLKRYEQTLQASNLDAAQEQFKQLTRKLDKVSATSTMHKNTASRLKSRMARRLNALKAKVS